MKPFSLEERKTEIGIMEIYFDKLKKNYLNVNAVNLDLKESLFRIFNYEYFLKDLENNTLTLVSPDLWDDPFENFLLKSKGKLEDGREVDFSVIRGSFYSQCWSLKEECDGLWRNYRCNNEDKDRIAIKAKTTSGKLFENVYDINDKSHYLSYFIGKVDYVSDEEIADYFKKNIILSNFQTGIEFALTLLTKRKPFAYEEEVRIIVHKQSDDLSKENPTISLKNMNNKNIINEIVEEIVFDPWVEKEIFQQKKQKLLDAGFTGKISKSELYDQPFFIAKIEPY